MPEEGQDRTEKFDQCDSKALFRNTQKQPLHGHLQSLDWTSGLDWWTDIIYGF